MQAGSWPPSKVEAGELLVEPALELRVERSAPVRGRVDRGRGACPAPAAREHGEHDGAESDSGERENPREQVEAALRRRREHALPELVYELRLDLALRVAGSDPGADERAHAVGDRRVRERERRMAGRTDDLVLELGERRVGLTRRRAACGGEREDETEDEHASHQAASASRMLRSRRSAVTGPSIRSPTRRPSRSTN